MTQTLDGEIANLRTVLNGSLIVPADAEYDRARRVWNAAFDRLPAAVARCSSAADVSAAVVAAQAAGLEITVRGGGHNTAGTAVCDNGLMIDLSSMNSVTVDASAQRAHVGGGALLRDVDAATTAHGLAVPAGLVSHTGIGGLTLGGGMGWLTRKFGLTVDNLASAEIVTADGRVRHVSANSEPDLFWAIRGGGGNFGVVTSFEFALHRVSPMVDFGFFFWDLASGPAALALANEVTAGLDPNLNVVVSALNAPPAPFIPAEYHGLAGYALILTGFDGTPAHAQAASSIRGALPPLVEMVTPMPYVQLQQFLDDATRWGQYAYEKALYVDDLSGPVAEVMLEHVARKPSPTSAVMCYRLDGAFSDVSEDATAFSGGRSPRFGVFFIGYTTLANEFAWVREWARTFWDALRPYALGGGDGYANASADLAVDRVRQNFSPKTYARLAEVKADLDPRNVFHHNANIPPA
jgi:FAD/FMN-containing dehydrogenase